MQSATRFSLMRRARMMALAGMLALGACGGGGDSTAPAAPTLQSIEITPTNPSLAAGTSTQLAAVDTNWFTTIMVGDVLIRPSRTSVEGFTAGTPSAGSAAK